MVFRVEGKNIGDEGFGGANVRNMETGRMDKEAAAFLSETIRKAITPIEYSIKTNKVAIALTAKKMAEAIKDNTQDFQEIIQENGQDTQDQLLKLLTMMSDAQKKTGDASVLAIKDVIKQIEKIKESDPSGRLTKTLGLDEQQKDLSKKIGRQTVFGAAFKKFTNVDLRTESAMSALSPTKLFGLDPGAGNVIADQKAQLASERATGNLQELGEALVETKKEEIVEKATTTPTVEENAEGGSVFATGIDRESLDNKQVELLEQILAQLKTMEGIGAGEEVLDTLTAAGLGAVVASAMMKGLKAVRILGPLAVLKDVFDIVAGTDGGATAENVGGVSAGVIGGIAGFMIGGPAGAAIGAGIGNAIGDMFGGFIDDKWQTRETGPERTRRTAGGRETTTDAPLSFSERQDMEEYGTIDREEIQRIQLERAGYTKPTVEQTTPVTQLTPSTIKNDPNFQAGILAMTPELRESFFQENPELRFNTSTSEITAGEMSIMDGYVPNPTSLPDLSPEVTRTADAVGNMSNLIEKSIQNAVNNIFNTTNNNYSGSSGDQFVISAQRTRNADSSFRFYQQGQNTR